MIKVRTLVIISIVTCISTSCATTAKYEEKLKTWLGHSVDELVNSWGYPANSFEAPNGNKVYVYSSSRSHTSSTHTTSNYNVYGNTIRGNSSTTGGKTRTFWCQTFFEVDTNNIIVRLSWKGNNCTSW